MRRTPVALTALALLAPLSACAGTAAAGDGATVTVTVGYQSRTINTVTAGTLLRSLGSFEKQLNALHDGHTYKVAFNSPLTIAPVAGGDVINAAEKTTSLLVRGTSTAVGSTVNLSISNYPSSHSFNTATV